MSSDAIAHDRLRAERLTVTGVVQGVGFRPFVFRLATERGLAGFVGNDAAHVFIEVTGPGAAVDDFVVQLGEQSPPLARVETIDRVPCDPAAGGFRIVDSAAGGGETRTLVPPDVAVCSDCTVELFDEGNRRFGHPFITCTNCGPRFTIITSMPYDRPATTMAPFEMCALCRREYEQPSNRRYHAQPISCHDCGPQLQFRSARFTGDDPIVSGAEMLRDGLTVAVKGLGGYHLACDATSDTAVDRLRARKQREHKPFAVMARDLAHARLFAHIDAAEATLLTSPAAPIVLVAARPETGLSQLVAPGNPLVGIMLAYTPLHHLLLTHVGLPLVMTSANRTAEPLAFTRDGLDSLAHLYDGVLDHDREILVPCDDSVARVVRGQPMPIRRARGYTPLTVAVGGTDRTLLATGGELKNTFCLVDNGHAWVSQHLGDMENLETLQSFEASVEQFSTMYDVRPSLVAVDSHPGYVSSRWGRGRDCPVEEVQHHHAHVAAMMAEHGLDPNQRVIGVAFDGTGYGDDGSIWGGEILVADGVGFDRFAYLSPFLLPGGDVAIRSPFRVALALLHHAGVPWSPDLAPVRTAPADELHSVRLQLERGLNVVTTSSIGRLFDAVASLLDIRHRVSFEAQAAIELEFVAASAHPMTGTGYRFGVDGAQIQWQPVLASIMRDLAAGNRVASIGWRFHDAVAEMVQHMATRCRDQVDGSLETVALTGGVFQNALLVEMCVERLEADGFRALTHQVVPPNDGGLALGQAFIAAHRVGTHDLCQDEATEGS